MICGRTDECIERIPTQKGSGLRAENLYSEESKRRLTLGRKSASTVTGSVDDCKRTPAEALLQTPCWTGWTTGVESALAGWRQRAAVIKKAKERQRSHGENHSHMAFYYDLTEKPKYSMFVARPPVSMGVRGCAMCLPNFQSIGHPLNVFPVPPARL